MQSEIATIRQMLTGMNDLAKASVLSPEVLEARTRVCLEKLDLIEREAFGEILTDDCIAAARRGAPPAPAPAPTRPQLTPIDGGRA